MIHSRTLSRAASRPHQTAKAKSIFLASAMAVGAFAMIPAFANHTSTLSGSNFEIDTDANLTVEHDPPSIDWASVAENRRADEPSGSTDDSFGNGTKEDTAVPSVIDGSIPPNKSDLLNFGVYFEPNTSFMHVFWHRVQEPSGTTNMDFEFSQSETTSSNGVTPVRTEGDMLIQYDLSQGGTNPQLFLSRWITSNATSQCEASNKLPCWSARVNLSDSGDATGSINTASIDAANADSLGSISARTFGEATVDLSELIPNLDPCDTFASAYLKSRSSDSFTAALKDFIAPADVGGDNCGDLTIVKTDPNGAFLAGAKFKVYKDDGDGVAQLGTLDVQVGSECTTTSANGTGTCTFNDLAIGDSVWIHETVVPTGYVVVPPNPRLVTITSQTQTVTFVNRPALGALKVVKTDDGGNAMNGVTFTLTGTATIGTNVNLSCVTGVSNSNGSVAAAGECSFIDVPIGIEYTLAEGAVPAGYAKDPSFPRLSVDIIDGQIVTVNVTNPRTHRVVVLVCHEGTDTLLATSVTNNGGTAKTSIGSVPSGLAVTQKELCDLGGASFGGLAHGNNTSVANISHP